MEAFIRSDQFNYIKKQVQQLVNGYAAVQDEAVLAALRSLAQERVLQIFQDVSDLEKQLLETIAEVRDREEAERYTEQLRPYVIPFPEVTEKQLAKLFPKTKKLTIPKPGDVDYRELTYLSWIDKGSTKKYIVVPCQNNWIGLKGTFTPSGQKGICSLCNQHELIGLFVSEGKDMGKGRYVKKGNDICRDSITCNRNLTSLEKLKQWIDRIQS